MKSKVKGCKHYDNKVMTAHAKGGGIMAPAPTYGKGRRPAPVTPTYGKGNRRPVTTAAPAPAPAPAVPAHPKHYVMNSL